MLFQFRSLSQLVVVGCSAPITAVLAMFLFTSVRVRMLITSFAHLMIWFLSLNLGMSWSCLAMRDSVIF